MQTKFFLTYKSNEKLKKLLILFISLSPFFLNAQVFVNHQATGANNGTSWTDAYIDLQDAIQNAATGAEVWVATGTYLPSQNGNVTATFELTRSIALFGGFAGTESSLEERNVEANRSTLSGDYNGDDIVTVETMPLDLGFVNFNENANRIITVSNVSGSITIDGFTISGGRAPSGGSGAGMLFAPDVLLDVTVRDCIIKENFSGGTAGAIRLGASGGEVLNFRLENCIVFHNECNGGGSKGGVLWATGSGITNADYINNTFFQNYSSSRGGVASHDLAVNAVYTNCIFSENIASAGGATFENSSRRIFYYNCTFYQNATFTTNGGAAIQNFSDFGNEEIDLYNCIFYQNTDPSLRGQFNSGFNVRNCMLDYESFADLTADAPASSNFGENQFLVDPEFLDGPGVDFNLAPTSPAINAGNNDFIIGTTDNTGYIDRIVDGIVDIGALEYHLPLNAEIITGLCFGEDLGSAEISAENYPPFQYEWSDSSIEGPNPQDLSPGDYQVTVTNAIGDREIFSFTLTENPAITADFDVLPPTGGNPDGAATVIVGGGTFPFTYEWDTDPIQTGGTASGLPSGTYTVTITDAVNCQFVASVFVGTDAVKSVDDTDEIEIGPNPFSNEIRITLSGNLLSSNELETIHVYDALGRLVYSQTLSQDAVMIINPGNLSAGLYTLILSGEELSFRKRLLRY